MCQKFHRSSSCGDAHARFPLSESTASKDCSLWTAGNDHTYAENLCEFLKRSNIQPRCWATVRKGHRNFNEATVLIDQGRDCDFAIRRQVRGGLARLHVGCRPHRANRSLALTDHNERALGVAAITRGNLSNRAWATSAETVKRTVSRSGALGLLSSSKIVRHSNGRTLQSKTRWRESMPWNPKCSKSWMGHIVHNELFYRILEESRL